MNSSVTTAALLGCLDYQCQFRSMNLQIVHQTVLVKVGVSVFSNHLAARLSENEVCRSVHEGLYGWHHKEAAAWEQ